MKNEILHNREENHSQTNFKFTFTNINKFSFGSKDKGTSSTKMPNPTNKIKKTFTNENFYNVNTVKTLENRNFNQLVMNNKIVNQIKNTSDLRHFRTISTNEETLNRRSPFIKTENSLKMKIFSTPKNLIIDTINEEKNIYNLKKKNKDDLNYFNMKKIVFKSIGNKEKSSVINSGKINEGINYLKSPKEKELELTEKSLEFFNNKLIHNKKEAKDPKTLNINNPHQSNRLHGLSLNPIGKKEQLYKSENEKNEIKETNKLENFNLPIVNPTSTFTSEVFNKTGNLKIKNFSGKSHQGKNEYGQNKINQDSYFVKKVFPEIENFYIFGVFDGHGKLQLILGLNGHFISNSVKQFFLKNLSNPGTYINNAADFKKIKESDIYIKLTENNYRIISKWFHEAEQELINTAKYDVNFSGTTAIVLIVINGKVICANCGDSRAFLAVDKKTQNINAPISEISIKNIDIIDLSRDHKPDLDDEYKRIIASQGRVFQLKDEYGNSAGPSRVWLKYEDVPGIAMSRSIGDFVAVTVGVISDPGKYKIKKEFIEYDIDNSSRFIVIGSDGLFEFLSNKRISDILIPYYKLNNPNFGCEILIEESIKLWKKNDTNVDDITSIVIFFNK